MRQTVKSRILYASVWLLSLFFIRFHHDKPVAFMAFYSLSFLPLFSGISIVFAPLFIRVREWASEGSVTKNEPFHYKSMVKNRGIFPYAQIQLSHYSPDLIQYQSAEEQPAFFSITPLEQLTEEHIVRFPYRGVYRLGIQRISVVDFLGIFRYTFTVKGQDGLTVTVYPDNDDSFTLPVKKDLQNQSVSRYDFYTEPNTDINDLRKYTPTDDYRKIHWKLSAKRYELIVKEYEPPVQNQTMLYIDTQRIPLKNRERTAFEDRIVSIASSAICFCSRSKIPLDLVCGNWDTMQNHVHIAPSDSLNSVSRLLAELRFERGESQLQAVLQGIAPGMKSLDLVLFLWEISADDLALIKASVLLGRNVILHYFLHPLLTPYQMPEQALEEIGAYGVHVTVIHVENDWMVGE